MFYQKCTITWRKQNEKISINNYNIVTFNNKNVKFCTIQFKHGNLLFIKIIKKYIYNAVVVVLFERERERERKICIETEFFSV